MSRVLELSDKEYARLKQAVHEHESTIAELVHRWISSMAAVQSEQSIIKAQER